MMDEDNPEEITASENEVTEPNTDGEEITLSEEDIDKIKKDYWTFTSTNYWGYLSCFLLFLWFSLNLLFPSLTSHSLLMVIIPFSRYIYLMKNDDEYEFSFFNQSSYLAVMFQITLFLCALWGTVIGLSFLTIIFTDGCLSPNGYVNSCDELIRIFLLATMLWLFAFFLSFKKKVLKADDDDSEKVIVDYTPKVGLGSNLLQIILGLSAFLIFTMGFMLSATWGSELIDGFPFYSISFILLVCMLALGLRAQGPSQEPLEIEKIKVLNWIKFKTRMVVLVVVFSLILAPMWYVSQPSDPRTIDLTEDCNDEIVGPDVNLVGADFSDMMLQGCDLSNRDLTGADFRETNLACVDFSNSILVGAVFRETDVRGAVFDNADLSNANFSGEGKSKNYYGYYDRIIKTSCEPYDLSFKGANLTNANFETTLYGSTRGGSKLAFDNAIMDDTNFVVKEEGFSLISFDNATMDNANLVVDWSNYATASMVNVSFNGTKISMDLPPGSNLSQSNMSEANFIDFLALDLSSCPLSLPETYNCVEIGGKKMIFGSGMDFSNKYISFYDPDSLSTDGPSVNFSGLYLPNSTFHGVRLSDSNMSNANLSNSNFTYNHKRYNEEYLEYDVCMNDGTNCSKYAEDALDEWGVDTFSDFKSLWSANLTNVDFTGSNLSYSDFSYSNMLGAKLDNATLTGVKWYYTTCPAGTNSGKTGSCVS